MANEAWSPAGSAQGSATTTDEACSTAGSAQGSATTTEFVAIRGGGIANDAPKPQIWHVEPCMVQDVEFLEISARDPHCRRFFQKRFAMVRHIKAIRNAKTLELMTALSNHEGDPNDDMPNDSNSSPCKSRKTDRPRRELIDDLPKVIDLEVHTRSGIRATVRVTRCCRRSNSQLEIELTDDNLDLMREDPPAASAQFNPAVSAQYPTVRWVSKRNSVRCTWWDSKKKRWKTTSRLVEFDEGAGDEEKESAVNDAAAYLQSFYESHHNIDADDDVVESPAKKLKGDREKPSEGEDTIG